MFVTTAGRTDQIMIEKANEIAQQLQIEYVHRRKRSIPTLQQLRSDSCIVVGKERLELYPLGFNEPFFFHPNSAMFRIKRLQAGEHDPFIEATNLSLGKEFLDCTLGLASDSIVASFVIGSRGTVVGVEGNEYLSYLVKVGLKQWDSGISAMNEAMNRIQVEHGNSLNMLKTMKDNSFDCVYFDPMFEENIVESDGIKGLTNLALYEEITEEYINEALRVARERIVLKDHFRSNRFEKFSFKVLKRKTAKFHFGILKK
ncbi:class I SAM-dependent methyltransferase [Cytobacillus sp. FJAT-54145]|uniref:Class I SAM-dependent methyltransferase n=1 Tax=Cytobacillus spartinae TaxID=3299023 RepID=A0ABW6KCZ1_9BACI